MGINFTIDRYIYGLLKCCWISSGPQYRCHARYDTDARKGMSWESNSSIHVKYLVLIKDNTTQIPILIIHISFAFQCEKYLGNHTWEVLSFRRLSPKNDDFIISEKLPTFEEKNPAYSFLRECFHNTFFPLYMLAAASL